jgi:hypothetical protein
MSYRKVTDTCDQCRNLGHNGYLPAKSLVKNDVRFYPERHVPNREHRLHLLTLPSIPR